MGRGKPPQLAVTHDEASCEPQQERSNQEMAETAEAPAPAVTPMTWRGRRGGLRRRCGLIAGRRLGRSHVGHLVVGGDGEERTVGGMRRSHLGQKRVRTQERNRRV